MTTSAKTALLEPYEKLPGVPPRLVPRVRKLCGPRYADLLVHLPHGGFDRRHVTTIAEAEAGTVCTLKLKVLAHKTPPRRGKVPWKIVLGDDTGQMTVIFFHGGSWLKGKFPEDKEVIISGTVEGFLTEKQMVHPEVFPATDIDNVARIWPQYSLTGGVSHVMMGKAMAHPLALLKSAELDDWLPPDFITQKKWPRFGDAIRAFHQPQNMDIFNPDAPARKRLAFDELFAWQTALIRARDETRQMEGFSHSPAGALRQKFVEALSFSLTADQQKVIEEIDTDMHHVNPMLRLVQGDVGSGKTVVAFTAALRAIENGCQAAMMAPTEILATQHYQNARKILEPLGITCALLKGKMKVSEKKKLLEALADGRIQMAFGTHALIQEGVDFRRLSLVIIDEQHRFGVRQRLALTDKGLMPDVLVMTATPIPRTLSLTAYGDMDVSLIKEKPPGRTPVKTTVMSSDKLPDVAGALKRLLEKNEQIYWVCPLVEESEKSDLAAATMRFEELQRVYGDEVALLHGRMKPTEKDAVMQAFKAGNVRILVSTTVIEVGVDVPQATTMVIEHAERFGLAQLHQLRGRVGRGTRQSHCMLIYAGNLSEHAAERLQVMRDTEDGFIIAEKDMELRGPGETLGTQQSGHIFTRVADLRQDKELLFEARNLAQNMLKNQRTNNEMVDWLLAFFGRDEAGKLLHSG